MGIEARRTCVLILSLKYKGKRQSLLLRLNLILKLLKTEKIFSITIKNLFAPDIDKIMGFLEDENNS